MAKKKREEAHGGHGWFVTFADLMALLLAFFVMLVAFSTQDSAQAEDRRRLDARCVRRADRGPLFRNRRIRRPADAAEAEERRAYFARGFLQYADAGREGPQRETGARLKVDREFALASASLRQALQDMPELTEMSKHIMFEETKEGLNLEIVDQDGRSMFADGSKVPYDRTRRLIQKLAVPLKATPLRVNIVGHTAAGFVPARSEYGAFDLSADRANVVRQILEREGLPPSHIFAVGGKADSQPLFPDDPTLPANRRVTITLMRENPPLPPNLKP